MIGSIAGNEMAVVHIGDIGDSCETGLDALPHLLLALEATPPRVRASWRLKDAILGEELHDGVHVVAVEGFQEALEDHDIG